MAVLFLTILAAIGVALAIRNPLQAHPFPFYAVALVADALTLWGGPLLGLATDGNPLWAAFYGLMRRGIPAFALFTVVMFVGCLKNGSRPKRWLAPVRAELSILACVLSVPQITYDAYWFSVLLTAVLGVLGVLSFKLIRNRMPRRLWKGIQRLAYPFFVMVYVHVVLVRLRPQPRRPRHGAPEHGGLRALCDRVPGGAGGAVDPRPAGTGPSAAGTPPGGGFSWDACSWGAGKPVACVRGQPLVVGQAASDMACMAAFGYHRQQIPRVCLNNRRERCPWKTAMTRRRACP